MKQACCNFYCMFLLSVSYLGISFMLLHWKFFVFLVTLRLWCCMKERFLLICGTAMLCVGCCKLQVDWIFVVGPCVWNWDLYLGSVGICVGCSYWGFCVPSFVVNLLHRCFRLEYIISNLCFLSFCKQLLSKANEIFYQQGQKALILSVA